MIDHRIILGGRTVNPLASQMQGAQARNQVDVMKAQAAERDFMRQNGGDVFSGNQNALMQLATINPQLAMGIQGQHQAQNAQAQANSRANQQIEWQKEDRARSVAASNNFRAALGVSESGGNYGAKNSEGFAGKYQFGQARLDDFNRANGSSLTLDQFQADPNAQEAVQAWHEQDIMTFVQQRGLDQYIGQEIAGVQITPAALVGMAHIGGKGGMAKFLATGGRYDPADSNGTKISDYGRKFSGTSLDPAKVQVALLDPHLPEAERKAGEAFLERHEEEALESLPDFDGEQKLRKEFLAIPQVKDFSAQAQAYGRIIASADDPSPAGDLALVFNYMKLLDPGSVVRESEFALAAQSGSFGERIQAAVGRIESGEILAPEMRADFVGRSKSLYENALVGYESVRDQYKGLASEYGIDGARAIVDFSYKGSQLAPTAQPKPTPAPADPSTVGIPSLAPEEVETDYITKPITKDIWATLPPGTPYMDPEGQIRIKGQ